MRHYSVDDTIKFKQWLSTDRSQLEDKKEFFDNVINILSKMFYDLTEHNFIAKNQATFSEKKKELLKQNQSILVMDFAENYHSLCKMLRKDSIGTIGNHTSICILLY